MSVDIPDVVRNKALAAGAHAWLRSLPILAEDLSTEWSIRVGEPFGDGTEAFVAAATGHDHRPLVLKLIVPRGGSSARHEITALELAGGVGAAQLVCHDADRGALLLERLGPSLRELGVSVPVRHRILCDTAQRFWREPTGVDLPTGPEKAEWLADNVLRLWSELDRPCSELAVEHAIGCADRRGVAHRNDRARVVHGDVHQWNVLRSDDRFKLIDPDGLVAEREYDLGIIMREDPLELIASGDPRRRARWLARRTALDATSIWEWGVVERVSTGLLATAIGLQPVGRYMLDAADRIAAHG